jgi:cystathionine beta-synthase
MAAFAAAKLAAEIEADPDHEGEAVIVVLLPDSGRGYLTKVFNDDWLAQYGFLAAKDDQTVGEVLRAKSGSMPDLVHTHPNETVAEAINILREYGVSQMPVVRAEPPVMAAEVAGSVSERALLDALFVGNAKLADQVEAHMSPPLPTIGGSAGVAEAISALGDADALLVQEDGRPVGVLTRADLLTFIAAFRQLAR